VLADLAKPATSDEIATAAGLDERYVREWLGAMTAGRVVEYSPPTEREPGRYLLPPEHAGLVTRAAGPLNLTTYCQYIPLLGQVEDEVVEAFRHGGGVPYDRFPQFHAIMAETSYQRLATAVIPSVVPLLGGAARLEAGADVADVGCGRGRILNILAAEYPQSRFVGFDIAEGALEHGRAEAEANNCDNIEFLVRDAAALNEAEAFDIVTSFDAVHDQAHPDRMLAGIHAALRPGGRYLCVEPRASSHLHENLDDPGSPMMYAISTMHCMTVSLAEGGQGLGTAWGRELAQEMLTDAGFVDITETGIDADRNNSYFLARKPERA
jgi:2-polyprenyl-3-methyl-5-hydroxy-6-metoxy-1,4-benzoquinol methylase